MFDSVEAFRKQFTPVEGGFLYFPTQSSGGKLVTNDEYAVLEAGWVRAAGTRGQIEIAIVMVIAVFGWVTIEDYAALPGWASNVFLTGMVVLVMARFFWASRAPRRLIRNRPEIVPPRQAAEVRRVARNQLPWSTVILAIVLSGAALVIALLNPNWVLSTWLWIIGSGTVLSGYLWIAFRKLRDQGTEVQDDKN